jgi:glycosyltransferase involved in cell wall biosynthesis
MFCDNLLKEQSEKCLLILHTEPRLDAGTDLIAVKDALCPNYDVIFSPNKVVPQELNLLYNLSDVTINASSNEGFGLGIAESIMAGTPVIVSMTGGLQDQVGQTDDKGNPVTFTRDFGSNSCKKYSNVGPWAYPVWPACRDVQGSIPTPYIFDDMTKWEDFAEGMMYWYLMGDEKRTQLGAKGREWALGEGGINSKNMCDQFINAMDYTLANFSPNKEFDLYTSKNYVGNKTSEDTIGCEIPKIDIDKLKEKISKI